MNFPKAQIYNSELEFISECVINFPTVETGGDFFGFWSREGNPVIQYVTGPGDNTTRTEASFYQDIDYLHECGTILNTRFGLEHIGAWHSHHQLNLFRPSSGDVRTMRNALKNMHPSRFLISICNIQNQTSVSIGTFLFSKENQSDYTSCLVSILSGDSPIRDALRKATAGLGSVKETRQKVFNRSVSYYLRDPERVNQQPVKDEPERPLFVESSFWSKQEGHKYLKRVYDKLRERTDLSDVGIKQLADSRPAIAFNYQGTIYEIRFPNNFPTNVPEVVAVARQAESPKGFWRKKIQWKTSGSDEVFQIVKSLNVYDDDRNITIQPLQ